VCYTEKLLERFLRDGALSDRAIDEVAQSTRSTLIRPLKSRVKHLADVPTKSGLMKDVFNIALDADLFGRSRILNLKEGGDLIEQALGHVDTFASEGVEGVKVCLAERLVVDSVIEYFEETGKLEPLINDYLHDNQFHEGAFGDAAEVGLAASVKNLSSESLSPQERFISVFQDVYWISENGCAFNADAGLANCVLVEGVGVARDYSPEEGGKLGLTDWLRRVCEGAPRPTFLFPEPVAGPDLMFVFKEKEGNRRVIFAVQVCGKCHWPPYAQARS
jgi:hypothetical protein